MTPIDDRGGAIDCFDHCTVVVADVETACTRYESLLGLPPSWRGEHPDLGTRAALFGLSNGLIELVGPVADDERAEGMRSLLAEHGEGMYAIAFGTRDAAACSAELRARGVRATPPQDGEARSDGDGPVRTYRAVELSPRATRGLSVLTVERSDLADMQSTRVPWSAAVDALDHVVIGTSDPDAAIATYGDGLGIRLALDRNLGGTRMLFFRVGGVTIEVVQDAAAVQKDRFRGLAYRVGDIEAAHRRLSEAGFDLNQVRDGHKGGTQVFTVRDGTCGVPTLIIRDPSRDP